MRRQTLPVAALLVGCLLLAGAATAAAAANGPTAASSIDGNETTANESAQAGICVVGADSPCNGEQWDGDARTNESTESGTAIGGGHGESGSDAGICVIGADSPCNDDRWERVTAVIDALLESLLTV